MLDKAHLRILRNSAMYAAAGAIGCKIGSGAPIIIGFFLFFTMFVMLHLLGFPWRKGSEGGVQTSFCKFIPSHSVE